MESQSSQPSLSTMRQAIPARSSTTISAAATNPASSYPLPVELMMYPTQRPLMAPSLQLHNCLLANQLCTCAFGAHSCSIHHAPIAYGQASSSFVAPTAAPAPIPSAEHPLVLPPTGPQDSRQNETARRETRLPPTLIQPVRSSLRLKRGAPAPLPAQVQSALDEVRAPKLRRIPGDAGREIQTVASETMQQPSAVIAVAPVVPDVVLPPPSTSQLVTGPVPSSHGSCTRCHGISPSQCTAYPSSTCQCSNFCPGLAGAQATIVQPAASRSNYPPLPSQVNHPLSNQVISQFYTSAATAAARTPAAQAQAMAQDMQMLNAQIRLRQQQLQQQQQLMNQAMTPNPYRLTYFSNGQLYVPVRSLGIETLLVNVAHPDYLLGERPLDRHHMFAAPVTEPQPIGCTLQDIEKHSEKMQYIKDGELPDTEQERCIVCQCELETGEEIRNLSCSHQFHVDCIDRWLSYNKKCPVCRLDIDQPKDTVKGALWIE